MEVDIYTLDYLKVKFLEMIFIFKNIEIGLNDIGFYMKEFVEENGIMTMFRRVLIGSYKGEKILFSIFLF